jgi:hypothetical protein
MKKIIFFVAIVLSITGSLLYGALPVANQAVNLLPAPTPYVVVDRDANSKIWERTTYELGSDGKVIPKQHRYTELAAGLNYKDDQGQWADSQDLIETFAEGAVARRGQYQVIFANNLNSTGAIDLQTPDGKRLRSNVLGLAYYDDSTGNSVLIAQLQDSEGQLISDNQILYSNAFAGVNADVRYTYKKGSFSQDVILRAQPPAPETYGLKSATTELEVVTEFIDPPAAAVSSEEINGSTNDDVAWGALQFGDENAFDLGGEDKSKQSVSGTREYRTVQGRNLLFEKVPVKLIQSSVSALPLQAGLNVKLPVVATKGLLLPKTPLAQAVKKPVKYLAALRNNKGYVLDYEQLNTATYTNYTFQSNTTYYVNGIITIKGTNTFESGTVIKYGTNGPALILPPYLNWPTDIDNPVIFTAKDDDTVGEILTNSTGVPTNYYAQYAIYIRNNTALPITNILVANFRIAYAGTAIYVNLPAYQNFVDVNNGEIDYSRNLFLGIGSSVTNFVYLNNILSVNIQTNYDFSSFHGFYTIAAQNSTFSNVGELATLPSSIYPQSIYFTNCIFANVTNYYISALYSSTHLTISGSHNGYYQSFGGTYIDDSPTTTTTYPFQTAAAANYYLATNSTFHDAGTTIIDPNLLAELQTLTTYSPQDGGALDTNTPDLGYHYSVNEDSDFDGLPDWWEWYWLGTYSLSGTNLDCGGINTLSYDFANGINPNVLQFNSIDVTNNYVNASVVPAQLSVSGLPYYITIIKDDTNFDDAVWNVYSSSNITLNIGSTQGWHSFWIGLRGHADDTNNAVWQFKRLKLDTTAPVLTVTNPAVGTVTVPLVELQGYSSEDLSTISYDITNAAGLLTNQDIGIADRYYDTNTWEYTTNYFRGLDIALTNGLNTITLHATDLAGNVTTLTTNLTLNYATATNPVVKLYWPTDSTLICNTNYTWRGWVDDPTATITAQLVDTNGTTNFFGGVVERNGNFWVEDLPLSSGTNWLTLNVTNAAGLGYSTNITVFPGAVSLTIDTPTDDLWNQGITVNGTISDTGDYTVWVNGNKASYTDGTSWTATNVYLPTGGTALIQARAIPNTNNGGNGTGGGIGGPVAYNNLGNPDSSQNNNTELQKDKPAEIYIKKYDWHDEHHEASFHSETPTGGTKCTATDVSNDSDTQHWDDANGGNSSSSYDDTYASSCDDLYGNSQTTEKDTWPLPLGSIGTANYTDYEDWNNDPTTPSYDTSTYTGLTAQRIFYAHCTKSIHYAEAGASFNAGVAYEDGGSETHPQTGDLVLHLRTGGKGNSARENLFCLSAEVHRWTMYYDQEHSVQDAPVDMVYGMQMPSLIDPTQVRVDGQTLGSDGNRWRTYKDGDDREITPKVKGEDYYSFGVNHGLASGFVNQQKYKLHILANGYSLAEDRVRPQAHYCVGEYIGFDQQFSPSLPSGTQLAPIQWAFDGTFVNTNTPSQYPDGCPDYYIENTAFLTSASTHAWWIDGKYDPPTYNATLGEGLTFANGQYVAVATHGLFTMHRPRLVNYTLVSGPNTGTLLHNHNYGATANDKLGYINGSNPPRYNAPDYHVNIDSKFGGEGFITQIFNGYETNESPNIINTFGTTELDAAEIYPYLGAITVSAGSSINTVTLHDNPYIKCIGNTAQNLHFTDYIRFNPDPNSSGISVTLGTVTWYVIDSTQLGIGGIDYVPAIPPATTFPYFAPTGSGHTDGNPTDSEVFPYWDHTVAAPH